MGSSNRNIIVIKVGTSSLTDQSGKLNSKSVEGIAAQVSLLARGNKHKIVLVSSGAVAAGTESLDLDSKPTKIKLLQAISSVGQTLLMNKWTEAFEKYGIHVGQILLSQQDFIHREQYLNARNSLYQLMELDVIPVINENDATSVEELRLGDNDILSAMVATLVKAKMLILVTDTDFLYKYEDNNKIPIPYIEEITSEILSFGAGVGSKFASGGMATKLQAAQIATNFGVECYIVSGKKENSIIGAVEGKEAGTRIKAKEKVINSRKAWIAFGRLDKGEIVIDDGAKEALVHKGKSLLPAGITGTKGNFKVGDTVKIVDSSGKIIAKGLTNYSLSELEKIKGKRSQEILNTYGEDFSEEAIHRDCLVLLV